MTNSAKDEKLEEDRSDLVRTTEFSNRVQRSTGTIAWVGVLRLFIRTWTYPIRLDIDFRSLAYELADFLQPVATELLGLSFTEIVSAKFLVYSLTQRGINSLLDVVS